MFFKDKNKSQIFFKKIKIKVFKEFFAEIMIMNTMLTITKIAILLNQKESFKRRIDCYKQGQTTD